jgi:hypothetical protein
MNPKNIVRHAVSLWMIAGAPLALGDDAKHGPRLFHLKSLLQTML